MVVSVVVTSVICLFLCVCFSDDCEVEKFDVAVGS